MMRHTDRPRHATEAGVTLIELMVTVVVLALAVSVVMVAFLGQNQLIRDRERLRDVQDNARTAMAILERYLMQAGYGIGPEFAFDFEHYECDEGDGVCRDRVNGPDEIVFMARDPLYFARPAGPVLEPVGGNVWEVASIAENQLNLESNAVEGRPILEGQVFFLRCTTDRGYRYLYVTAGAAADMGANPIAVPLRGGDAENPFRQNLNANIVQAPCLQTDGRAFAVNRYRFYIADEAGERWDPAGGDRPYLFLDTGLVGPDGPIRRPVAADIEDLQVAYLTRDVNGGIAEFGSTAQNRVDPNAADIRTFFDDLQCGEEEILPVYRDVAAAGCLMTDRQSPRWRPAIANISTVRVSLVARTTQPVLYRNVPSLDPDHAPERFSLENRDRAGEANDGRRRIRHTTSVEILNTNTRGIPVL